MTPSKPRADVRTGRARRLVPLFTSLLLAAGAAAAAPEYTYSYLGNPNAHPIGPKPVSCLQGLCTPSVVLMGGGYDVGAAFRWLIARAGVSKYTGGRFVVIRATGSDAYNPYIYSRLGEIDTTTPRNYEMVGGADLGLSSVETLIIPSRKAAADPFVLNVVARASAIFIAGGDQADYYNDWQGTPLDTVLQHAIDTGVPVGGTSAGTAMLGQYAFVALIDGVTSQEALTDPFNQYMSIDPLNTAPNKFMRNGGFLDIATLRNTIVDDHVNTRDRLGRLLAFVARIGTGCPGGTVAPDRVLGIGVDEETAVLVSGAPGRARAEMVANPYDPDNTTAPYTPQNSAYFVRSTGAPQQCARGKPLVDYRGFQVYRLSAQTASAAQSSFQVAASFNLADWSRQLVTTYADGSSLTGPNAFGAAGGVVLGPQPY